MTAQSPFLQLFRWTSRPPRVAALHIEPAACLNELFYTLSRVPKNSCSTVPFRVRPVDSRRTGAAPQQRAAWPVSSRIGMRRAPQGCARTCPARVSR